MSSSPPANPDSRGRVIFYILLIAIGCIALWFVFSTESMGIEERFSSALGLAHEGDQDGEGGGFALEGSPVLYALVLLLLGVMCWVVYRRFGA